MNTIPVNKIPSFTNEFKFLSNMYPCKVRDFLCSESYYQSMKCPERANEFKHLNGYQAKQLGKKVKLRLDWDNVKIDIMRIILNFKFQGELLEKLKTIEGEIVERNTWNDTFWGVCKGKGENHLGKLLMEIRDSQYTKEV